MLYIAVSHFEIQIAHNDNNQIKRNQALPLGESAYSPDIAFTHAYQHMLEDYMTTGMPEYIQILLKE